MANQNAGSIIKTLDVFGRPVAGTFKNKDTYGTIVGGALTIVFILIMFLYVIILFIEPMDKTTTSTGAATANTTTNETDGPLTLRNLNNANTNLFPIPHFDSSKESKDTANVINSSQDNEFESKNKNRDLSTSNWMYEIKTEKTLVGNDIYDDTETGTYPFVFGFMLGFRPQIIAYTPTLYTIEYLYPTEDGLSSYGYMY